MKQSSYSTIALALVLAVLSTAVRADIKDPLPDSLSLGGVTLYGTVDIGFAYQSTGVPISSTYLGGLEYQAFTTTRNFQGSQTTVAESGLEQSKIGVRVQQPVGGDVSLVARIETGFNPLSGQLTDACASINSNGGKAQGFQTANADSSRCGQTLNGVAYGGFSSPTAGTLTFGRHNSLELDTLAQYDPQALSYAFSFLGYSGFNGGSGSTEAARWDNAVKYAFVSGPVHFAVMYTSGGQDTGVIGHAYGGNLGFTANGWSVDAVYQNITSAVNLRSSFDDPEANPINPVSTAADPFPVPGLAAYVSDDTSYNLMAKYTMEFGDTVKDKLTLYAGYSHIEKAHGNYYSGSSQGNYPITVGINITNTAVYEMEWLGARYAQASGWNYIGGLYHVNQGNWTLGLGTNGPELLSCGQAGLLCSGDFYEGSFVVDYVFNKHYDVYGGVNWSEVTDGLANGFQGTTVGTSGSESQTTVMGGLRIKF
jgi:predicted porin